MARTEAIDFRSFVRNEKKETDITTFKVVSMGASMFAVMIPRTAFAAAASSGTGNIWPMVLNCLDWICVGVIVFAGVSWMFGHRTKAIELLIGGALGYVLARHAIDIKDWLKGI